MKKLASSFKHTHVKARVQNPYPICDQNSWKTIPFGAAHTYIAHLREYPPLWENQSAVPENIHTPPTEGIGISWGMGSSGRSKKCKEMYEALL